MSHEAYQNQGCDKVMTLSCFVVGVSEARQDCRTDMGQGVQVKVLFREKK